MKKVKLVAGVPCKALICPAIYETEDEKYLIKGFKVDEDLKKTLFLNDNEDVVEIPKELIYELIRNLNLRG